MIVDLCCGAGAIGAVLAAAVDRAEVHAADIDPAAVRCARRNVPGPWGHVYQGDLYEPLPGRLRGRVGVLVANVPYVPTGEIGFLPPEARAHEPRVALDGGEDGLDVLRRVAAGAPEWLAPGGHLLIETSERQAPSAQAAFVASGLGARVISSADLDATVVLGRLRPVPRRGRARAEAGGRSAGARRREGAAMANGNGLASVNQMVVLMLENRSFDHMLGFLYPGNVSPSGQPFDGLTGSESTPGSNGQPVTVFPIGPATPSAYYMPGADPGEGYMATNDQLYGSDSGPASAGRRRRPRAKSRTTPIPSLAV